MSRSLLTFALVACTTAAQEAAPAVDEARALVARQQWRPALDILLPLRAAGLVGADREAVAALLVEAGRALRVSRSPDLALRAHEEALALRRDASGERDHPAVAESLYEVASTLSSLGRKQEALARCESALAMQKRLFGDADHEAIARSLDGVANSLRSLGRTKEAVPMFEAALAMERRVRGDADHRAVAQRLEMLAHCLSDTGMRSEALAKYEEALAMRRRLVGGGDDAAVAKCLAWSADALTALGRAAEAVQRCEEAAAMQRRLHGGRPHGDVSSALDKLGFAWRAIGREPAALAAFEAALAIERRLHPDEDHLDLSVALHNTGVSLQLLGRPADALPLHEQAVAMDRRLRAGDHDDVAIGLSNLGGCLQALGRLREALGCREEALAIWRRLRGERDDPQVAMGINNLGFCLQALGRHGEALALFEQSLAMRQRLHGGADHDRVATSLNNVAFCLEALGRARDALPLFTASLAMHERLRGGRDDPLIANGLSNLANCLEAVGRDDEALPRHEAALAMRQRLYAGLDHPEIGISLSYVARRLQGLGRVTEALPLLEQRVAMERRLHGGDHALLANALGGLGACLLALDRRDEALVVHEEALAMLERVYGPEGHPETIRASEDVATCLLRLGRFADAVPRCEAVLAAWKRRLGERDHHDVARSMRLLAWSRELSGDAAAALPLYESALAMHRRLHGDRAAPPIAWGLNNVAGCLEAVGRRDDALATCRMACATIEELRESRRFSADVRQSFFDALKDIGAFERLQRLAVAAGDAAGAMQAADRARSRSVLDLVEQQGSDPLDEAEARARRRGDEVTSDRVRALRVELDAVAVDGDRILHQLARIADDADPAAAAARRAALASESAAVERRRRQLLDERARLAGDVLPVGRARTTEEVQASLRTGELLLMFSVADGAAFLHVAAADGPVQAHAIPAGPAALAACARVADRLMRGGGDGARGRDPGHEPQQGASPVAESRELFAALVPPAVWTRVRAASRVFVAAHRGLHRLPFEALVTDVVHGRPVYWIDAGPPISYVPSGSMLHWLRRRARDAGDDATTLDLLAVADPGEPAAEPEVPEHGVLVTRVPDGGEGARIGLQARDVLVAYDGKPLADDAGLRALRAQVEADVEDGRRPEAPIALEVWRRGATLRLAVAKGALGIEVGRGSARRAHESSLGAAGQVARVMRAGDVERLRRLPPLRGAREEVAAIAAVCEGMERPGRSLVGTDATEPAVFDLAAKAKYLHFACHGIAEEYAGQSLSMLVLSQPESVVPGDDGLLKLGDLLHGWRGRLASCRLVVLSACQTNVGPTLRDEAPQALPLGFLFAGAPAVISSLWAVDDASTKELMVDFYSRLLAGATDQLAAFTAARRALRAKHPDPFHWAPFLYMGSPE